MKNVPLFCILLLSLTSLKGFATITISPSTFKVCVGGTKMLTDNWTPGTWTSSDVSIATVGSTSGQLTGVSAGTVVISYHYASYHPLETVVVTVNETPTAITGSLSACVGTTSALSSTPSGGTWVSAASGTASVNSSGVVTAVTNNNTNITYTLSNGCKASVNFTVNPNPAPITKPPYDAVCIGYTSTYTNATSGGSWSSSATTYATVDASTGIVTGLSVGTGFITYLLGTGCKATADFRVFDNPLAITGPDYVCVGANITLEDASPDHAYWSSSNTSIATVTNGGVVTGVSAGTVNITFFQSKITGGGFNCFAVKTITVGGAPITGDIDICVGETTSLANPVAGGAWSSSNTSVATVGSTGVVSGVSAGTCIISYYIGSGCESTVTVTVSPLPEISGTLLLCEGSTSSLSATPSGGTWSSGNTAVATVGTTGILTGVSAGTSNITYTSGAGCFEIVIVTVNSAPVISGTTSLCLSSVVTLTGSPSGGTWSSSNSAVASIGSSGILTGLSAGTAVISYILENGCFATITVTVGATTLPNVSCKDKGVPSLPIGFDNDDNLAGITVEFTTTISRIGTDTFYNIPGNHLLALNTSPSSIFTPVTVSDVDYSSGGFPTGWTVIGVNKIAVNYSGCRWASTTCHAGYKPGGENDQVFSQRIGEISIVPNPNNGMFRINGSFPSLAEIAHVEVMDIVGNSVYNGTTVVKDHAVDCMVSLDNFSSGLYFVRVKAGDASMVTKILVDR
ncbi:MAG: Ig-like domain-containing protein [Chitinophagaceae bacterium]|nr:Ig-like domain-containing protein [Chitinophagaceae bacterium]